MRHEFDLDSKIIYLNTGTHSIVPRSVLQAVQRYQNEFERNPTQGLINAWAALWERQKELAAFFDADPRDLFLCHNVTQAMNAFILGMPLPKGSEILLSDLEYGAVRNICRFRAERDGLNLRTMHLPLSADLTREVLIQSICQELRPETKLLVLSHVFTGNGLIAPIEAIAAETRRRGILLAIDGAHGAGALPLSFSQLSDVDFYGSNFHKWMLGPKGTGFGWVHPMHQDRIIPLEAGWPTFEPVPFDDSFGGGSRFAARMAMKGCRDFALFFALRETLEFWKKYSPEKIRSVIRQRQTALEKIIDHTLGWKCLSPAANSGMRGPLLTYDLPPKFADNPRLAMELFKKTGLQVAAPRFHDKGILRLSPHVYNTDEEALAAAKILSSSVNAGAIL